MDVFDFEELIADMLDITDEQREDDDYLIDKFSQRYDHELDFEAAFRFARDLLRHIPKVKAGLSGKEYHAFVSKSHPIMLMKVEASR